MDFMNLNQAAHGDREHGFIMSRMRLERKVVAGYWQDPAVQAQLGAWCRAAAAWHDWQEAKFCRFGDNMREVAVTEGDKVAAQTPVRVFGQRLRGGRPCQVREGGERRGDRAPDRANTKTAYVMGPGLAAQNGAPAASLREAARIEAGLARLPERRRFQRFHHHLRGPARPRAIAGPGGAAAHGRGLRFRGGRRLEDLRPGAGAQGHGQRSERAAPLSWKTTPIT